jgi:hypothetical protein
LNILVAISISSIEFEARIVFNAHVVLRFIIQIVFFYYISILVLVSFILTDKAFACILDIVWKKTIAHSLQSLCLIKLGTQFILYIDKVLLPLIFSILFLNLNHLGWRSSHLRPLILLLNNLSLHINWCYFKLFIIKVLKGIVRVWFRELAFNICFIFLKIWVLIFIWFLINFQTILIVTCIK